MSPIEHGSAKCGGCRMVQTCKLFETFTLTQTSWNERYGELIKFPLEPQELAAFCKLYESPLDVIKLDDRNLPKELTT